MNNIVKINCLEHIYPDRTRIELCGIEFTVCSGEKTAILGPNGSGKTTLLKHILGLLAPYKGEVLVFGQNPTKNYKSIRNKIGVVLQNIEEQLIGPTVLDDIMFSPLNFGYTEEESLKMAENIMGELNISHLRNKIIHYLSGGEKKKVAIAGALVHNPELLIMDEPFSNLDPKSEREYIELIDKICTEKQISLILSTHNIERLADVIDTVFLISANQLSKKKTVKEIFYNLEDPELYNLEKPSLVKMTNILAKEGLNIGEPLSPQEAAAALLEKFKA